MISAEEYPSNLYPRSIDRYLFEIPSLSVTFSLAFHLITLTRVDWTYWNFSGLSIILELMNDSVNSYLLSFELRFSI